MNNNVNMKVLQKQKILNIKDEDGQSHQIIINKWTTTQQWTYLPVFGKLFSPLAGAFLDLIKTASSMQDDSEGKDNYLEALNDINADPIQNSLMIFFEVLCNEGNIETILNDILLSNVIYDGNDEVTMDSFEDIDQVFLVAKEVLQFNYSRLLSGKGFMGFLQNTSKITQSIQE